MGKVTVMGSFMYDIAAWVPHFPVDRETDVGCGCKAGPGGKGSKQAVAAAKTGAEVIMIAKVGKDDFAKAMFSLYEQMGISSKYCYETDQVGTGTAPIIIHKESGQNRIAVILGANATLTKDEIMAAEAEIASSDVLLTQFETCKEAVDEFLRLGKKYNKIIIVNPAPINKEMTDKVFDGVDYVTPNETEAAALAGMDAVNTLDDARDAAKKILEKGAKCALITLGSNGSFLYNGQVEYHVLPPKVNAVDTTGAGDAFNGGFACAKSFGLDDLAAMKFATCTAAISITRPGSSPSMPTREEVLSYVQEIFPD